MARLLVLLLVVCTACAPQDIGQLQHRARFETYPEMLFSAFEEVCTQPVDTFRKVGRDSVECRSYLTPDATAATILRYGGTTDSLPQLVMRVNAQRQDPGYIVILDAFLNVPQKNGKPVIVVHRDPIFTRKVNAMMRAAGGIPETPEGV